MLRNKPGIHRIGVSIYGEGMDTVFDDLSSALREPHQDVWSPVRAFAMELAGKLVMGLAIGLGIAVGLAIAG